MSDLLELLKFEAFEIDHFFQKASIEGRGTPQEVADRREAAVKKLLEKFFPFPYRVTKGNIIDSFGKRSASIDCLVLHPSHPYTVAEDDRFSMIFVDGVDFAIEVKPDLTSDSELERALKQIQSVKKLTRRESSIIKGLSGKSNEYIETSKKVPGFIFCSRTYEDLELLFEKIVAYYNDENVPKSEQFDYLIVNRRGVLCNSRMDSYCSFGAEHQGLYFLQFGEQTIAAFLLYLNQLPQCQMKVGASVLSGYLNVSHSEAFTFPEVNSKLIASWARIEAEAQQKLQADGPASGGTAA